MAADPESVSHKQTLDLRFKVPGRGTTIVAVAVWPNDDPVKVGQHLTFPDKPTDTFFGYPICQAKVTSPDSIGYAALYGWIQMVADSPAWHSDEDGIYKMDLLPIMSDLNNPFCWFGPEPQLFDAPSRWEDVKQLDWTAVSFLTYIEDSALSRAVRPVLAFEWGFWIVDGEVRVKPLKLLDVTEAWEQ